jgi:type VI protein secretion system component Hcp
MLKANLELTKAIKSAVQTIAKRLRYNGAVYERFIKVYRKDRSEGVKYLEKIVRDLSLFDIEHNGKTDKYHYKLTVALFDLLDWEQVAVAVVAYSVEDAESRNPNKTYKGYTRG